MKTIYFIAMSMLTTTSYASQLNLTDSAYRGVFIGMQANKVVTLLPQYRNDKANADATAGCYYLQHNIENKGLSIMIIDEQVARFDVVRNEDNILMDSGLGIGSSKQEVLKFYPQLKVLPHEYLGDAGEYLEITLASGNGLIFETEFDVVAQYRFGKYPEVQYIEGCL